jgi:hypothetical protein
VQHAVIRHAEVQHLGNSAHKEQSCGSASGAGSVCCGPPGSGSISTVRGLDPAPAPHPSIIKQKT